MPADQADGRPDPEAMGAYSLQLWEAWADCYSKVGLVCEWAERQGYLPEDAPACQRLQDR